MKNINIILSLTALLFFAAESLPAQENKKIETAEFEVSGVCQMCEKRIEEAALIKGVKLAEYDLQQQTLKVIYKTKHTDEMAIQQAVADAGHDTEKVKASDESYKKLPDCCAYRDGVEIH